MRGKETAEIPAFAAFALAGVRKKVRPASIRQIIGDAIRPPAIFRMRGSRLSMPSSKGPVFSCLDASWNPASHRERKQVGSSKNVPRRAMIQKPAGRTIAALSGGR
jgi:hypothetical protein